MNKINALGSLIVIELVAVAVRLINCLVSKDAPKLSLTEVIIEAIIIVITVVAFIISLRKK